MLISIVKSYFRNGYYGHPGSHIDPGGGQWHEPVAGAGGGEAAHVPREGSPSQMGHHYQHIQQGQAQGMYPACKIQGGPPR